MENSVIHLFVYGSLRSGFHHPAYKYISKYFTFVTNAKVKGLLYDAGEYPAAISTTENFFITGELYKAKSPDDFKWAIEQLDAYEGVEPEEGEVPLFKRELTDVTYQNTTLQAWIYWYNKSLLDNALIPSGDFAHIMKLKSKS